MNIYSQVGRNNDVGIGSKGTKSCFILFLSFNSKFSHSLPSNLFFTLLGSDLLDTGACEISNIAWFLMIFPDFLGGRVDILLCLIISIHD